MSDGLITFPLWIELSGLPRELNESAKSPLAWSIFKKVVELDCARNRLPGTVEISLDHLGELIGVEGAKVRATLVKMRKAKVLRMFLPDNDEEEALFQVAVPLPTPMPFGEVRLAHNELFTLADHQLRYAIAEKNAPPSEDRDADPVLREVVDLYFNTVSMKMNSFILDELRLIAARFELPLIRKVFAFARTKEIESLGWVLRELRREQTIKEKAKARREASRLTAD